jgi:hypothetical protein
LINAAASPLWTCEGDNIIGIEMKLRYYSFCYWQDQEILEGIFQDVYDNTEKTEQIYIYSLVFSQAGHCLWVVITSISCRACFN